MLYTDLVIYFAKSADDIMRRRHWEQLSGMVRVQQVEQLTAVFVIVLHSTREIGP